MLTETNANAVKTYKYNSYGLPSAESTKIGSDTFRIDRYYDRRGNDREDNYYKNGTVYQKLKYVYDNKNRINSVYSVDINTGTQNQKVKYYYDANDNVASAHYGNNTYQVYYYNAANLIHCMDMVDKSDNSKKEHLVYRYRLDGNMSGKTETYNGYTITTGYAYDSTGRLTEENVSGHDEFNIKYTYDSAGNRSTTTLSGDPGDYTENYSYDKNNRLISSVKKYGTTSAYTDYTYDKNGNQTKIEKYTKNNESIFKLGITTALYKNNVGTEKFTYNGLNQLTGYESTNGQYNGKVGLSAEYKYMANGYRLSKSVNGYETRYLWDRDNIVSELNSVNVVSKSYVRGYNLICDSSDNYYMSDIHGNVIEIYGNNSTAPDNRYLYTAFGENGIHSDTDTLNAVNKWGYCGQLYDWETGNYYMRARYYNPDTGRFISEDPIKDGGNWYSYCNGNPIMFFDFSGLSDIYIFYYKGDEFNGSLSDRAYKEYNYLKDNTNFSVEIKQISTQEDFEKAWNSMDNNGDAITKVSLYMHSNSRAIITSDGGVVADSHQKSNTYLRISELDKKEIYSIHLFACNSANLDHLNNNIAYEFAINQNVQYVYGWDGSMDWNRITGNPQLASGQQYFYGNLIGPKRSPEGQIVYRRDNSTKNIQIRNVVTGRCYGLYDANGNKLVYEQSEPIA